MTTKRVARSTKNVAPAAKVAEAVTIKTVHVVKGSWSFLAAIGSGIKSGAVKGWNS